MQGFVHRRYFGELLKDMSETLVGKQVELKAMVPVINKSVSLFDYLTSLYVTPTNLLVNYCHHLDVVAEAQKGKKIDTNVMGHLKNKMKATVS